ncbi:hypothetical protein, partial, partial [Parasitella parasitica]
AIGKTNLLSSAGGSSIALARHHVDELDFKPVGVAREVWERFFVMVPPPEEVRTQGHEWANGDILVPHKGPRLHRVELVGLATVKNHSDDWVAAISTNLRQLLKQDVRELETSDRFTTKQRVV